MAHGATALEPPVAAQKTPHARARTAGLPRPEIWTLVALFTAALALRVAYVFAYPFDSDEPQHLHVAWAWTKGLLPYRDVFDNHAPLFHILSAPFVAIIGETPRILVLMRLAMIPLSAATLWASFLLGRRLFGTRSGLWSAVICGLSPTFFFKSLEYRADVLWGALWILAIAVLLDERLDARRGFYGGLLLGACLAVSLKTTMLLAALAIASAGILLLSPRPGGDARRRAGVFAASVLGGLVVLPLAIVLFFMARGALRDLIYCTVEHNLLPDVGRWGYSKRTYLLLPILALLLAAARFIIRRFSGGGRAAFLLLLAGSQYLLLSTLWPVHTRQDLLPFYPLFTVLLAGILLARRQGAPGGERRWSWAAPGAALVPLILAVLELAVLPALSPIAGRGTASQERLLAEVLALTDPDDYVLDMKGQAVFRNRPFYHALETMTLERMARGMIEDTIPERCIATRTCVASADIGGFPPRARRFLQDHYVVVGVLRVAGGILHPTPDDPAGPIPFDVTIPARYAVVSARGDVRGTLDGRPYDGPRDLDPGRHVFVSASGANRLAVIWAQAAERGFSPFGGAGEAP
jgi:dolichyl-phosphate-mannose-protein mannosyltransferase